MSPETLALLEAVDQLQHRIQKWEEPIREFWEKNPLPITSATRRAGDKLQASLKVQWNPYPELNELLDTMCRNYLACDSASREEVRRFVCDRSHLVDLVFGYIVKLAEQIKGPEDVAKLRIGVTAVSIISAGCDWRDVVYVALGGLYKRARRRRIDARAVLREIAEYSSEAPLPHTGTSIAEWLRDYPG